MVHSSASGVQHPAGGALRFSSSATSAREARKVLKMLWTVASLVLALAVTVYWTNQMGFLPQLWIPVAAAAMPLVFRRRNWSVWVAASLLGAWVVVAAFSVGFFYVPALLVMLVQLLRLVDKTP